MEITRETVGAEFDIQNGWYKFFSSVPMPMNTVIQECIVDDKTRKIKYIGISYTGGRNSQVIHKVEDFKSKYGFIPDSFNESIYWRLTGIAKS